MESSKRVNCRIEKILSKWLCKLKNKLINYENETKFSKLLVKHEELKKLE